MRALPGILSAGAISDLPAVSGSSGASRTIFHATDTNFQSLVLARPVAMIRSVTSGYFAASGTSLRAGRFFTAGEQSLSALISESLAKRLWPGESPAGVVGHTVRQGNVTGPLVTVTGVVEDVHPGAVDREPPPTIYRPYEQWASGPMTLVVRTAREPSALAPAVRAEIRKIDANLPIPAIRTMREVHSVFSDGMRPVLIGLVVGLGCAIAIARAMRSLLFGITPTDPISLGGVVLVLLVTSASACYLPARRAAALDPMTALRHE